jgi:hypothetical protein
MSADLDRDEGSVRVPLMPSWIMKSATHRVLSWLPRAQEWNSLLQTYVTRSMRLTAEGFEFKLARCRKMIDELSSDGSAHAPKVLEIGTGWYPIIPIGLYICGATSIWTLDVHPLLKPKRVREVLRMFCDHHDRNELRLHLPSARPDRIAELRRALESPPDLSATAILRRFGINVVIGDARRLDLPDRSVDFIFSESVLMHMPMHLITAVLSECRRVISEDGMMIHSIGLSDLYSRFDPRITEFNMYRFSGAVWRIVNSPLEYQNRLRVSDYRLLHQRAGFEIRREESAKGNVSRLRRVRLHDDFRRYSTDDLLVTYTWLVSVPATTDLPPASFGRGTR